MNVVCLPQHIFEDIASRISDSESDSVRIMRVHRSSLNINMKFILSRIHHLAHSSGTYKKQRRGQSGVRGPTVRSPHAPCNDAPIDIDGLFIITCNSDVTRRCNNRANGSWQVDSDWLRCILHKFARRGVVKSCPHGAKVDGRVEGAHREASAAGAARPRAGPTPSATILPQGLESESSQAYEYRARQVSDAAPRNFGL